MAKPKNKKSTKKLGLRGRDAVRKSTLKVNIKQVFTIDCSEIQSIVSHNSQSKGQNKSAKSGMNLRKKIIRIKLTPEERRIYKGQWYLTLNKAGKNAPVKLRSDHSVAVLMKNRLHHESGEPIEEPIFPGEQRRIQQGQEVFSGDHFSCTQVDQHTGWKYWPSSTSSVKTTPQMTRFRDAKVCTNWLQMKLTITEYSLTTSA